MGSRWGNEHASRRARSPPSSSRAVFGFLRVHDGDRRDVHDVLDVAAALQDMDGLSHAHENRADSFGAPQALHELIGDIG